MSTAALSCLALTLLATLARAETLLVPSEFLSITEAVAAAVPGDEVVVSKGVYFENVVLGTEGVVLRGKQATIDGRYLGPCVSVTADAVIVEGLRLVNGAPGLLIEGELVGVHDVQVVASQGAGIDATSDLVILDETRVLGSSEEGIRLRSLTSAGVSIIADCRVERCAGNGIDVAPKGAFLVVDCRSERNGGRGIDLVIDEVHPGEPTRLLDNRCRGNAGDGIGFDSVMPVLFEGNDCCENGGHGISGTGLTGGGDRNRCDRNAGAGIDVELFGSAFSDNRCRDNGLQGMRLVFPSGGGGIDLVNGCKFAGNGRDGLLLLGGATAAYDNVCTGNLGDGLDVDDAGLDYRLRDNTCKKNGHEGLDNSGQVTEFDGNVFLKNSGLDLAGAGAGTGSLPPGAPVKYGTGAPTAVQVHDL